MREIKFRGRDDLTGNGWVYGDFSHGYYGNECLVDEILVVEKTVGQFTGLLDCNGKEIYEGDIVKFTKPAYTDVPVVITWEDGAFMVDHELYLRGRDLSRVTIIGNIHDNPGLLERKP